MNCSEAGYLEGKIRRYLLSSSTSMGDGISIWLLRCKVTVNYAQQRLDGKFEVVDVGICTRRHSLDRLVSRFWRIETW
jgi:hypothetical protein